MHNTDLDKLWSTNTDLDELSSTMECDLLNSAERILLSVSNTFGDFTERNVDTRTKERPSSARQ